MFLTPAQTMIMILAVALGTMMVYCLRNVSLIRSPHGIPELIAIAVIVVLHKWKENVLLSIGTGTVVYMLLVQLVF